MLSDWTRTKLEIIKDRNRVLVRDPLRLLPEANGVLHSFARENDFTVIVASTNLVFRELYESAIVDKGVKRVLVIDRAPARRRAAPSVMKAPPPFYPDFVSCLQPDATITLDLRQFLREKTGDQNWPREANEPQYARLILPNLDGVLKAHANLRTANSKRFTDADFKTIVAYAVLGVPASAFKKLAAEDYWEIGLLGHERLEEIESLAPEITKPIKEALRKAPAPFCWFTQYDAETVLRAFYLSLFLAQHFEHWSILLANVDPVLKNLSRIEARILNEAAPKLIQRDPVQAAQDMDHVEQGVSKESLALLLTQQTDIRTPAGFATVLEKESYSTLFRSLALLMALDDRLGNAPDIAIHDRVSKIVFEPEAAKCFADSRPSVSWGELKQAYCIAAQVQQLRDALKTELKSLAMLKASQLTFKLFQDIWNAKRANRLEYFVSTLERLVCSSEFLPRPEDDLPSVLGNALHRIREQVRVLSEDVQRDIDTLNTRFQEMTVGQYATWAKNDSDVRLTSQFVRRCLKPHWDPQTEKAVLFIFDGMRYDIWDELLRPLLDDRMELIKEYPASSLLPSETHVTRKAISAGAFPESFDTNLGENILLQATLKREMNLDVPVEVVPPDTMGTGETVRYRAGNLDVYIFELCDSTLHHVPMKTQTDGRQTPSRPLTFIYQQQLKNILETEVLAIARKLAPATKVFITADHGFTFVHRNRIGIENTWLNESLDCQYRNARLRKSLTELKPPAKVRDNVWELPVADLRMPATEDAFDKKEKRAWQKQYSSIIFPKVGYALARTGPGTHFNPDAFSHGGISIQEMFIPMAVLRVREKDEGLIHLGAIVGPEEVLEGQEAEFRMPVSVSQILDVEIRIDVEASYTRQPEDNPLHSQVLYVATQGTDVVYRFVPDPNDATSEERRDGMMTRTISVTAVYKYARRTYRKSRTHTFSVRLNPDQVVRRIPAHLGNILGLTPKSMR